MPAMPAAMQPAHRASEAVSPVFGTRVLTAFRRFHFPGFHRVIYMV